MFLIFLFFFFFFFFNDTATTEIYTLSLHDALPIWSSSNAHPLNGPRLREPCPSRSEEHTSELQSLTNLVCRLLLEKKKKDKEQMKIKKKKKKNQKKKKQEKKKQ